MHQRSVSGTFEGSRSGSRTHEAILGPGAGKGEASLVLDGRQKSLRLDALQVDHWSTTRSQSCDERAKTHRFREKRVLVPVLLRDKLGLRFKWRVEGDEDWTKICFRNGLQKVHPVGAAGGKRSATRRDLSFEATETGKRAQIGRTERRC